MALAGSTDLICRAQAGDDLATTELLNIVRTVHMPRYTGKYKGLNVLVSNDEIESEFLLGVWKALPKAKLDVGNPINFICWKGQRAVQTLFRNNIRRETRYHCGACGHSGVMAYRAKTPLCAKCGYDMIDTWMVEKADQPDNLEGNFQPMANAPGVDAETAWQLAVYGIEIEELRSRLSGRTLELFDIIILEGINRDSSQNYLREISQRWGTSQMRVVHVLRKLRSEVEDYFQEEEIR